MNHDLTITNDTLSLTGHCDAGCKMAIDSMEQVNRYITNKGLKNVIDSCRIRHYELKQEASDLLNMYGKKEQDPSIAASVFSWISTEIKMFLKDDNRQIVKIMMNGCNMGIQSLCENINKYTKASKESVSLAKKIVKAEENFVKDLEPFL